MSFIDFHCHPSLKTFLGAENEENRQSCWEEIDVTGVLEIIDKLIGDTLDSQCSLTQLKSGHIQIAVAGLYSMEKPMITGELARIKNSVLNLLMLSNFIHDIDHALLGKIAYGDIGHYQVLLDIKEHLLRSENIDPCYKLLNSINELEENKLNIILSIEGGHSLFRDVLNYTDNEVLSNLDELKNCTQRFLYMTFTHLARCPLCTQAYGMKMIKDEKFIPGGYGISDLGYRVIRKALGTDEGSQRILIDVKHMSLRSRLQYYELIANEPFNNIPIIASHCGISGVSYHDMPIQKIIEHNDYIEVEYYKPKGLMQAEYNPWSINLYDEEIPIIINSNGIIGINLDERILGAKKDVKNEFFSKEEFEDYHANAKLNLEKYHALDAQEEENEIDVLIIPNNHLKHLCNNILHIIKAGGEDAWKHICIGSDFDGFIDAVNFCKSAEKFKKLDRKLTYMLPKMAAQDSGTDYFIHNIEQRVNDIMFNNAKHFLEQYFN